MLVDLVITSGGAGFLGHSRVPGAVVNDSSKLNVVIRATGNVDLNC